MFSLRNVYNKRKKFRRALIQADIDRQIINELDCAKNYDEYIAIVKANMPLIYNTVMEFRNNKDLKISCNQNRFRSMFEKSYYTSDIDKGTYDYYYSDDFLNYNEFDVFEGKQISLNNKLLR